jgi:hypothetical protein
MSYHYKLYDQRFARAARRADESAEAERNFAAARRKAKRLELQPEYEAVSRWQDEQIKSRGLTSQVVAETAAKLAELDSRVELAGAERREEN